SACYGIVQVPTGPWFCRKCESQERAARVRCELCPHKDGALKRTDNGGWAHVVCALYIPEVQFANVLTMEPIVLQYVPHDRFNKTCYICEEQGRESKAASGACMACNRHGCRQAFHVTCAQMAGLLCEEEVLEVDNVKYCGYCKYHFNKMKTSRHSGSSSFIAGRRSRSTSPTQEKHVSHHDRPKKSRKDKERPKQKHKKRPESPPSSLPPAPVPVTTDKGSTSHHEGSKETSEVGRSEVKGRKSSSHGSSHKGKKTGSGKSSVGFSSASSSGTFQPADVRGEGGGKGFCAQTIWAAPALCSVGMAQLGHFIGRKDLCCAPVLLSPRGLSSATPCPPCVPPRYLLQQLAVLPGLCDLPQARAGRREVPETCVFLVLLPLLPALRGPEGRCLRAEGDFLRLWVHHALLHLGCEPAESPGCLPRGLQSLKSHQWPLGGDHPAVNQALEGRGGNPVSLTHLPLAGIYTSNKDPISHGGGVLRAVCSTPLSSSLLAHQGTSSLPQLNRSPFASTIPASSSSVSTTQVFSLAGSTFSLPSSHIFGSPLTSGLSINPLLNQSESSRAGGTFWLCNPLTGGGSQGGSASAPVVNGSPISSLPTLFDQTVSCSSSGQLENVPQATPNIEQLLEKQGNGEAGVNMGLGVGASLLPEWGLTVDPVIPFSSSLRPPSLPCPLPYRAVVPVVTSSNGPGSQAQYILPPNVCNNDSLSISKSPPCKNSFGIENSLSTSSEDPHSGCPSRSSSSLSFHSTPPPLPMLQQCPASLPLPGSVPCRDLPALGGATQECHQLPSMELCSAPFCLPGTWPVALDGFLGQAIYIPGKARMVTPPLPWAALFQCLTPLPAKKFSLIPPLNLPWHSSRCPERSVPTVTRLPAPCPQEQQALVFQMMQQIQQKRELQRLQMSSSSQLSMSSLLAATSAPALMTSAPQPPPSTSSLLASLSPQQLNPGSALLAPQATPPLSTPGNSLLASGTGLPPVLTAQPNPFLNLQADGNTPKGTNMNEKGAPLTQDKG
ncbi:Protein AF-17, partial [Manacus vitellinus]